MNPQVEINRALAAHWRNLGGCSGRADESLVLKSQNADTPLETLIADSGAGFFPDELLHGPRQLAEAHTSLEKTAGAYRVKLSHIEMQEANDDGQWAQDKKPSSEHLPEDYDGDYGDYEMIHADDDDDDHGHMHETNQHS